MRHDATWSTRIVGERLEAFTLDNTRTELVLTTTNLVIKLVAEGDCCSNSWFEHVDDVGAVGGIITEFTNDPMPDGDYPSEINSYEYIQYDFMSIRTTSGRLHMEMRNSSNGYYGGYIVATVEARGVA